MAYFEPTVLVGQFMTGGFDRRRTDAVGLELQKSVEQCRDVLACHRIHRTERQLHVTGFEARTNDAMSIGETPGTWQR